MAISTCTVKAYLNTGCSLNNIPDSPARLNSFATSVVTLDVLNCLPLSGKPAGSVTVKAFSGLDEADYLSLQFSLDGTTIYATNLEYEYISLDTVIIYFTVDYFLTAGGIANVSSISGITKRHHVSTDTYGEYCMDDEYLIPSEPLEMHTQELFADTGYSGTGSKKVVASTLNLYVMGYPDCSLAFTYTDENGEKVTCPHIIPFNDQYDPATEQHMPINWNIKINKRTGIVTMPSTTMGYFDGDNQYVKQGIARAQELGVENGIVASYLLPNSYADASMAPAAGYWQISTGNFGVSSALVNALTTNADMAYEYTGGYTVQNKRLLYGSLRAYGMVSIASGDATEFKPEEIRASGDTQPSVFVIVDPRENGKPYFRFASVFGDTTSFNHTIRGQVWANAPISWQQASGSAVREQKFLNQSERDINTFNASKQKLLVNGMNAVISGASAGAAKGGLPGAALGAVGGIADAIGGYINNAIDLNEYKKNRASELEDMLIDNNVVAPTCAFPNDSVVRDVVGNGVMIYRYTPTSTDLARLDKILNMYGYKHVTELEKSFFTNRARYNYVEAADVHATFSTPVNKRISEGFCQMVQAGVRVWHVKPDDNFTTANAVV